VVKQGKTSKKSSGKKENDGKTKHGKPDMGRKKTICTVKPRGDNRGIKPRGEEEKNKGGWATEISAKDNEGGKKEVCTMTSETTGAISKLDEGTSAK